ncbi:hypothetical protein ACNNLQ_01585 [Aerococcus urinaeequi]
MIIILSLFKDTEFRLVDIMIFIFDLILLLVCYSSQALLANNPLSESLPFIGWIIIFVSVYLCYKVRNNNFQLLLMSILSFLNISLSLSNLITQTSMIPSWQLALRNTTYNFNAASSIMLFLATLNLFLTQDWLRRTSSKNPIILERKNNLIISVGGVLILIVILITGLLSGSTSSQGYVSNSNPLYEYFPVIFLLTWIYAKKYLVINKTLICIALFYIAQSFIMGDRSAAFLMVILGYLIYFTNSISIGRILIFASIAIILSNFIAEFRDNIGIGLEDLISNTLDRGFSVDTITFAYYGGITITALFDLIPGFGKNIFQYLFTFIIGSNDSEFANLAVFARENFKILFNRGGSFFPAYFYAFLGNTGVIFSATIFGLIIRKIFSKYSGVNVYYQILIITFAMRWYIYNPINLFRVVLVMFTVVLIISRMIEQITSKQD